MREFLRQRYPYVDAENIKLTSEGEDWSELRKLVASDSDLPDREEVLMLIDYHRDNIVKRKELLQKLNQGMAYRYIAVSYTHLRAHETGRNLVCRLLLAKKKAWASEP